MKINIKPLIFIIMLFSIIKAGQAQSLSDVYRGHQNNDLYFIHFSYLNYLYYITDDGANINLKNKNAFWHNNYLTETNPGEMYTIQNIGIGRSIDSGGTFQQLLLPWLNDDTAARAVIGGEIPGVHYIYSMCYSAQKKIYFKTIDSYATVTQVQHYPTEIGLTESDFYILGFDNAPSNAFLAHTFNDGLTFDTSYIPQEVINTDTVLWKLSRGTAEGELFLVNYSVYNIYSVYHSTDYGATWIKKNVPTGLSNDAKFTAGRGNCKFYIVDMDWDFGETYTLKIYTSSDCGDTYTLHSYELPTYVGLGDDKQKQPLLTVTPNPAGNTTNVHWQQSSSQKQVIQVLSSTGQMVLSTDIGVQPIGNQSFLLDVHSLSNGMYQIRLVGENGEIRCGKMVVCR